MLYEKTKLQQMMNDELPKKIEKDKLIDWFLGKQDENYAHNFCQEITVCELLKIAQKNKINVINKMNVINKRKQTFIMIKPLKEKFVYSKEFLEKEYKEKSVVEIAKELALDRYQVYYLFKKYNISLKKKQKELTKEEIERAYYLYSVDKTLEVLQISRAKLYRYLKKYKIKKRGKKIRNKAVLK